MRKRIKLGWVKCPRCGYEWETSSTHVMITCPYCYYTRVRNPYTKFPAVVRRSEQPPSKATA